MTRTPTRYTYYTADLTTGAVTDELPLYDVTFSSELNEAGEFRARLPLGDPRVTVHRPRELTEPGRTALYVERDGVLVWGGVIWTVKYTSADQHLEIGAAGFLSYFDHRRVLPADFDPDATDLSAADVPFIDRDQSDIARALVATAQAHPGGDIRVRPESTAKLRHHPHARLPRQRPQEHRRGPARAGEPGGRPRLRLRHGVRHRRPPCPPAARRHPAPRPAGHPARVGVRGQPDRLHLAGRRRLHREPGLRPRRAGRGENSQLVAVAEDRATGRPLTETEVSYVHLTDAALLASQARSALAAVSAPVVLPELTVRADLDPVLGSYQVGDDATVVIKDVFFPEGTQFDVRITGIEVTPGNDAGEEQVQLTVTPTTNRSIP